MYRCQVCSQVSRPKEPLKKHVVYRQDRSIEREVPVCSDCLHLLKVGVPLDVMVRQGGRPIRVRRGGAPAAVANGFHHNRQCPR